MKNVQTDVRGPGHQGLTTCGQRFGQEKQLWAIEKPKLDNAGQLGDSCSPDPEDLEFKETMKNARRHVGLRMKSAMPCEVKNHQCREICGEESDESQIKACMHR